MAFAAHLVKSPTRASTPAAASPATTVAAGLFFLTVNLFSFNVDVQSSARQFPGDPNPRDRLFHGRHHRGVPMPIEWRCFAHTNIDSAT
jgi:hypothetical protein